MVDTNRYTFRKLLPAAALLIVAAYFSLAKATLSPECSSFIRFNFLCVAVSCIGMATVLIKLAFLPISHGHTPFSAIVHYLSVLMMHGLGVFAWRDIQRATTDPVGAQTNLLDDLVVANASTEFGRKMNFATITDRIDYRKKVPLTTYADYLPYIDRIKNGENNLLTKDPIVRLSISSGTSGKCKLIPYTKRVLTNTLWRFLLPLLYRRSRDSRQPLAPLKMLDMVFEPKWNYSECGYPIGPVSAIPGKKPFYLTITMVTPAEGHALMPESAQMYIHWYYALADRDLRWIAASFGGVLLTALEFLRKNWKQLTDDIRKGRLTNFQNEIPDNTYHQLLNKLKPDPARADEIESAFNAGFQGVIKRLWPRVETIFSVTTGSHSIFHERIQWFAGPDISMSSSVYGASEAQAAVAMDENQDKLGHFTFMPTSTFFEFIPEKESDKKMPSTLFLDEVEVGKRYEVVVTSQLGFYRYRMGDVVKIVGFYNQTPVLEFCSRTGSILDLRGEKTTEDMVLTALRNTHWPENSTVHDFISTDCLSLANACSSFSQRDGLYYVFFIEFDGLTSALISEEEAKAFDDAISIVSYPYKSFRIKGAIKRPKIFALPRGTFDTLKRFILERNGAVSNQYKTPHYTTNGDILRMLYKQAGCT